MKETETRNLDFQEGAVLLIDKAVDWTSFDAVGYLRSGLNRILNIRRIKIGHAGTLDPKASGLLIICTGKFTKRINEFQDMEKEYTGTIRLGATTPSFDLETEVDREYPYAHITPAHLEEITPRFLGPVMQVPPAFSAIHIEGKRAYELARNDVKSVKMAAREVFVHSLAFTRLALPELDFTIRCGKGTYIRSLARDIGQALGSGGHLTALRRTGIGPYRVEDAVQVQDFLKDLRQINS